MPQTFANPMVDVARFPVTRPIDQIVAGLNAFQPGTLMGYPSMLALLAVEARAGRLRILPRRITTTSEPLLPEVRRALSETFQAPVANMYGTSEAGTIGSAAGAALASTSVTTSSSSSRSTWPATRSRRASAPTRCT
jgi:phenylacetate-coenzyme A ligase PaaK-like adenylate-forming protein